MTKGLFISITTAMILIGCGGGSGSCCQGNISISKGQGTVNTDKAESVIIVSGNNGDEVKETAQIIIPKGQVIIDNNTGKQTCISTNPCEIKGTQKSALCSQHDGGCKDSGYTNNILDTYEDDKKLSKDIEVKDNEALLYAGNFKITETSGQVLTNCGVKVKIKVPKYGIDKNGKPNGIPPCAILKIYVVPEDTSIAPYWTDVYIPKDIECKDRMLEVTLNNIPATLKMFVVFDGTDDPTGLSGATGGWGY